MNDFELNNNYLRVEGAPPAGGVRHAGEVKGLIVGRIGAKLAVTGGVGHAGEVKGLIVGRIGQNLLRVDGERRRCFAAVRFLP